MTLGWIGNILIMVALWQTGRKNKSGWIWSFAGNVIWCSYAIQLWMWDMFFVDIVCLLLAVYNWVKWRSDDNKRIDD
jgi:hypothetical protein